LVCTTAGVTAGTIEQGVQGSWKCNILHHDANVVVSTGETNLVSENDNSDYDKGHLCGS
jgi:hypothetical protein